MLIDIPKPVPTGEALMEFFRNVTAPQVPEALRVRAVPCTYTHTNT